jgi:formate hydrogenlyase subunit 6/NADH:ubiquinone oxidoreductase subunit I
MSSEHNLVVEVPALGDLVELLGSHGYAVVGPTVRDGVVVLDEITSYDRELIDLGVETAPGTYRTVDRPGALLGGVVGPDAPKRWMSPPDRVAWTARDVDSRIEMDVASPPERRAYFGIRPCDVAARSILDRFWPSHPDDVLIVAECTDPADTCFCSSMGTGPGAGDLGDIVLTELGDGRVLVRSTSDRGAVLLAKVHGDEASGEDIALALERVAAAETAMTRAVDPGAARIALERGRESKVWDDVARRCLACANCTMVCPTCFCVTISDTSDLAGEVSRRIRWDSCFTPGFSEVHGGPHRVSVSSRYRQWASHKFSTWWDQFGSAGCVGCGRCIAWCPVGIDITAEVNRIVEEVGIVEEVMHA